MNFILFSGPPRSGKDTAARIAYDFLGVYRGYAPNWEKFSYPNKRAFAGTMNVYCDRWGAVQEYEPTKDDIIPTLGVSYRQWQIDYSEDYMKINYGGDIFARLLINRCENCLIDPLFWIAVHIVSDCGFQVEVDALAAHDVLFFDVYRDDTSYIRDSRQRVNAHPNFQYVHLDNNESIPVLQTKVETTIKAWLP